MKIKNESVPRNILIHILNFLDSGKSDQVYRERRSAEFDEAQEYKYTGNLTCAKVPVTGSLLGSRSISKSQGVSFGEDVGK